MQLEEGPADADDGQAGARPAQLLATIMQMGVAEYVPGRRPVRYELGGQAGEGSSIACRPRASRAWACGPWEAVAISEEAETVVIDGCWPLPPQRR
jgi:hypothetical protein